MDQVSWDKIWPAADETPPTVHFCFIFHGRRPNHLVAGRGENKTDPVSFSLFSVFFEVSMASAKPEGGSENGCWKTPPSLCGVVDIRGLGHVFSSLRFLPSTYTLRSHIPFVRLISWSRRTRSCWCCSNPAITRQWHMLPSRTSRWKSSGSSLIKPTWCHPEALPWDLTVLWFPCVAPWCVLWYHSWNGHMMPAMVWGRFTG